VEFGISLIVSVMICVVKGMTNKGSTLAVRWLVDKRNAGDLVSSQVDRFCY
jgi:hypothetical protein